MTLRIPEYQEFKKKAKKQTKKKKNPKNEHFWEELSYIYLYT